MLKINLAAFGLLAIATVLVLTGCNQQQPKHPNQISDFDGATYDSLTLAHGALLSLRTEIVTNYPQYGPRFNQAATAYQTAFDLYSQFRLDTTGQTTAAEAINTLLVSMMSLEVAIQKQMQVPAPLVQQTHNKAAAMRMKAQARNLSISDILTELEIAATIAQAVPATSSYAGLASVVIHATSNAVAAYNLAAGQAIDLATIGPIPAI